MLLALQLGHRLLVLGALTGVDDEFAKFVPFQRFTHVLGIVLLYLLLVANTDSLHRLTLA